MKVSIKMVIGQIEKNHKAMVLLRSILGIDITITWVPHSVSEWFPTPFIHDENGLTYFGVEGVEYFVKLQKSVYR